MMAARGDVRPRHSHRWRWLQRVAFYATVVAVVAPILFPYYWMLVVSLKTPIQNLASPPALIFPPTPMNYVELFGQNKMLQVLSNSLIVGLASTLLGLVLGLPAAFAIARFRFDTLGVLILLARMLPGIAMLVPWYLMFVQLQLVGTHGALVFSHLSVSLPLIIWLSIGFFEGLPSELMDAAVVDGCSLVGYFWRVALPLVRPAIAASAMLAFIYSWNNFLYSLILGGTIKMAPVAAYNMISSYDINWGGMMAAAVVTTWPVILLSLPFGQNLVRGLVSGAVKG